MEIKKERSVRFNDVLHIRVDNEIKNQAMSVADSLGLSLTEAIRVFIIKLAYEKKMPFYI